MLIGRSLCREIWFRVSRHPLESRQEGSQQFSFNIFAQPDLPEYCTDCPKASGNCPDFPFWNLFSQTHTLSGTMLSVSAETLQKTGRGEHCLNADVPWEQFCSHKKSRTGSPDCGKTSASHAIFSYNRSIIKAHGLLKRIMGCHRGPG